MSCFLEAEFERYNSRVLSSSVPWDMMKEITLHSSSTEQV